MCILCYIVSLIIISVQSRDTFNAYWARYWLYLSEARCFFFTQHKRTPSCYDVLFTLSSHCSLALLVIVANSSWLQLGVLNGKVEAWKSDKKGRLPRLLYAYM